MKTQIHQRIFVGSFLKFRIITVLKINFTQSRFPWFFSKMNRRVTLEHLNNFYLKKKDKLILLWCCYHYGGKRLASLYEISIPYLFYSQELCAFITNVSLVCSVFSVFPCWQEALGISTEGFCIRVALPHEVRW